MKKRISNASGFTLVELMVVVAIIGILSAIAVPNFRKYQAKSKSSEAKLRLAEIYTAETSMYSDYDTYTTCLANIGVESPGAGVAYYAIGFTSANATANGIATSNGMSTCTGTNVYPQTKVVGGNSATAVHTGAVPDDGSSFLAGATGYIQSNTAQDQWSINDTKQVTHNQTGW